MNNWRPWSENDKKYLLESKDSLKNIANHLGRTKQSCAQYKSKLQREHADKDESSSESESSSDEDCRKNTKSIEEVRALVEAKPIEVKPIEPTPVEVKPVEQQTDDSLRDKRRRAIEEIDATIEGLKRFRKTLEYKIKDLQASSEDESRLKMRRPKYSSEEKALIQKAVLSRSTDDWARAAVATGRNVESIKRYVRENKHLFKFDDSSNATPLVSSYQPSAPAYQPTPPAYQPTPPAYQPSPPAYQPPQRVEAPVDAQPAFQQGYPMYVQMAPGQPPVMMFQAFGDKPPFMNYPTPRQ